MAATDIIGGLRQRAFGLPRTIVLTDGEDGRAVQAAVYLARHTAVRPVLVGAAGAVQAQLDTVGGASAVEVFDPARDPRRAALERWAQGCERLVRAAGGDRQRLVAWCREPTLAGALWVAAGWADGMVGGAAVPTAQVIRAGLWTVGVTPSSPVVSGAFVLSLPRPLPGGQTVLVVGDAAVVPEPTPVQLAAIACNTAAVARAVAGLEPKVALLSFSTKGSAAHPAVAQVQAAVAAVRRQAPALAVDGELQVDTALIPAVAARKAPGSPVAGQANVLIFPNLAAGNIGYKLLERVAGATAVGVVLSGLARPINDLSRGCSPDDILNLVAVTVLQGAEAASESEAVQ
jgi:phosphate acetyltransferase